VFTTMPPILPTPGETASSPAPASDVQP